MKRLSELKARYPTIKHLSADYNPSKANRYAQVPTRCVCGNAPCLADLRNAYGDGAATQWLIAQIVAFQEGVNTPNKMMPAQYAGLAETISQDYYFLKTTDIILFFSHLAAGRYNVDFHGYITPDVILDALQNKYIPYRSRLVDEEMERINKEREQQEKTNAISYEEYLKRKAKDETEDITTSTSA